MSSVAEFAVNDVLLRSYQRDFPLVAEPFAKIAEALSLEERQVIAALEALILSGALARVGGVVRPNTVAASTLAAVSAPELSTAAVAEMISSLEGVNHVYLRENPINIWFVATGPDRAFVEATLKTIEQLSGLPVLDLRLERSFHIDLGFDLDGGGKTHIPAPVAPASYHEEEKDRELLQILTIGIPLISRPFRRIGEQIGLSEVSVIRRLEHMLRAGIVTRIGAIIRHRAIGWRSNAMVVWDIPPGEIEARARLLAKCRGINLCYQRTRYEGRWPYNLYCMVHAKSRQEALDLLQGATLSAGLQEYPRQILFSSRCYKQTGALIVRPQEAA